MKPSEINSRSAFTLVELLAVIAIIALLAALILGLAGSSQRNAARKRAESEIAMLQSFVDEYKTEHGKVPGDPKKSEADNLKSLSNALVTAKHSLTNLQDPWDDSYHYKAASRFTCYIWSTAGSDAETNRPAWIGNPEPK